MSVIELLELKKYRELFASFNLDGNGKIDVNELDVGLKELGMDRRQASVVKMIDGVEEAISVNKISGGNAINILPDKVEAFVDFRFDPNLTKKDVEKIFHSFETENVKAEIQGIYPGIINDLKENQLLSELMDFVDESSIAPFWSDIGQLGQAGIPSVNYGPGSIDMAHRIDEYVPIVDMHKVRTVIKAFLS